MLFNILHNTISNSVGVPELAICACCA